MNVERDLGIWAKARSVVEEKDGYVLKEVAASYNDVFAPEMMVLRDDTDI